MRSGKGDQTGFAYLLLLVALAVIGVASAASVSMGATMTRRAAEEELLAIGAEYERALVSYQMATPSGQLVRSPKSLADLLRDPRYPTTKRHLRRVYADPLIGEESWGVIRAPDGTIAGIYSLAEGAPIKQAGFTDRWEGFNEAKSYANWRFGLFSASSTGSQMMHVAPWPSRRPHEHYLSSRILSLRPR